MKVTTRDMNGMIFYMMLASLAATANSDFEIEKRLDCSLEGGTCAFLDDCCDDELFSCISSKCTVLPPPTLQPPHCSYDGEMCNRTRRCCQEETYYCLSSKCRRKPLESPTTCAVADEACGKYKMCCDEFACVSSKCIIPILPSPLPSSGHVPEPLVYSVMLMESFLVALSFAG